MHVRPVLVASALIAAALLTLPAARLNARAEQEDTKSLFVSVLDDSGKPVKDMTADEFRLREDGTDREIDTVRPAQPPLQIVFLVDTSDSAVRLTQDIRSAVMAFITQVHTLRNDAPVELMEFGQAAVAATPFVTGNEDLQKALTRLVGKPGANAVLLEGLDQANADLAKRPSPRRAVVALNIEPSRELNGDTNKVKDGFRKSGAQLWSLSLVYQDIARATPGRSSTTETRNAMLQTLATETGGLRDTIVTQGSMPEILKQWADDLTYQYEIVYKRPGRSAKVVQVGTTRGGVHLHASGFAPQ